MTKDCRKSRFLERVLTVISNLGALRGSSARDILNYLLSSCADKSSSRNLTLQLQQALKQAVIAGLLKLQGGRYKIYKSSKTTTSPPKPKNDVVDVEKKKKKPKKKKKKKKKRKNSRKTREKRGENSEASGAAAAAAEKRADDDSRSSEHQTKKNPSDK